ncbi:hypothetical protein FisN_9Lh266 [Fistulifera solaris]|uniref:Uncharacterized protein n=1 Tax=Fistulifera solaris TaxID=1519565 RepID=A0A1Z5KKX9_FISSO|nr:hypothetical protein FisN_9Lh266 [Fistulifera solaris]|eukprot:GAX26963.1 hypothetical protein FisN_9Lh266 [Fistulifera solaris]
MSDQLKFMSYKSPKTVVAESVFQFMHGLIYGAAWGLVTPFPAPGSAAAAREAATGIFRPVPVFSSLSAVPSNAIFFASLLGYQRFCSKGLELIRRKEDVYNDLFGFAMIWPYYSYILNYSERRLILHNRCVGGAVLMSIGYATFLA